MADEMTAGGGEVEKGIGRPYEFRGEGTWWVQGVLWWLGRWLCRGIAWVLFYPTITGTENIPAEGPAILVTNHQSFLDPWIIGIALKRQMHYMARESLFKGGFSQWLLESLNSFPVKRGKGDKEAVRTAIERLKSGFLVTIFPESTRTTDGTVGPVAAGVAIIVHRAKAPVVPIVIDGAFEAWPRSQKYPHRHKVVIRYGAPIRYEELADLKADGVALKIREAFVALQREVKSEHAEASAKRLEADKAAGKIRLTKASPE